MNISALETIGAFETVGDARKAFHFGSVSRGDNLKKEQEK